MTTKPDHEMPNQPAPVAAQPAKGDAPETGADDATNPKPERVLSPAAKRALAEAEARRQAQQNKTKTDEREIGGRGGADPARYGDWEIDGRAIDF